MTRPARRPLVLILALVAAFGGFAGYQLAPWRESPRAAWEAITAAAAAGDYGAVWDRFDPASQRMTERLRAFAASAAPDRAAAMTDRERFVLLLGREADVRAQFRPARVVAVSVAGDRASVEIARPDPTRGPVPTPTSHVYLTFHGGRWRLSYGAGPPDERRRLTTAERACVGASRRLVSALPLRATTRGSTPRREDRR